MVNRWQQFPANMAHDSSSCYSESMGLRGVAHGEIKVVTATRAIAATALFAGLAIDGASTALAAPPTMSGHYVVTTTGGDGLSTTSDWYFTPCGDGCASVATTPGGPAFELARLLNGQWTLDWSSDAFCPDGSRVPGALFSHDTWDPNTLAGTDRSAPTRQVCGYQVRPRVTNNIQLTQASR
jgi:hypothetical protein